MIVIFNESKGELEFQSYESLFNYIKKQIRNRRPTERGQEEWGFVVHSPEKLYHIYRFYLKAVDILITPKEKEAYENRLNLLEMHKGDRDAPIQIILTPDVNLKEIKESWCRDYCIENGYTVSEVGG